MIFLYGVILVSCSPSCGGREVGGVFAFVGVHSCCLLLLCMCGGGMCLCMYVVECMFAYKGVCLCVCVCLNVFQCVFMCMSEFICVCVFEGA